MARLELKIPPPVVAAVAALLMWGLSRWVTAVAIGEGVRRTLTGGLLLSAFLFAGSALLQFGRARTTVLPEKPEKTSALVTGGIYRLSRNPMYVGVTLALLAWAVWLRAPVALLGPVAFVLYVTRFQIVPEERVLAAKFGQRYGEYCRRVRRWV